MKKIGQKLAFATLFIALSAFPLQAQKVFSIGTGEMPDPFAIDPSTDPDLNPALGLQQLSSFNDRGAWSASTSYQAGDFVTVGGIRYVVVSDMVSGSSFSSDIDDGRFMLSSIASDTFYSGTRFLSVGSYSNSGVWATNQSYSIGDRVTFNGISYIASETHTSNVFSSDSNAGYWVLASTAPDLADYDAPAPVNSMCADFDAAFQSGSQTYSVALPFFKSNLNNTGTDLDGTLNLEVTFDWENEEITAQGDVELVSFPAMEPGGGSFTLLSDPDEWTAFSFHTGNKCGRFKIAHSHYGYPLPNTTCFTSTMVSFYTVIQFYERGGKFIPVVHIHPISPTYLNKFEFYNSIFNDNGCNANTTEHYGDIIGKSMEAQ